MLGILVKKQLNEVFRSYFYDARKNRMRSKRAIAAWFTLFAVIMVGVLGGMFTALSVAICRPLVKAGAPWLYFLLMDAVAIALGAFGSVFNTYASLYLSRDNDLLLSLPIPVRTIIAARLVNVYLMGAMYAATALLPALIVYWTVAGLTALRLACGAALLAVVTLIVLDLSCALGWVVAKLSRRLRNKSFASVIAALLFMGAYYFFFLRAQALLKWLLLNAMTLGARVRSSARGLYLLGRIGEGDWAAAGICLAVAAALFALIWALMSRSFLDIAASGDRAERARDRGRIARPKSAFVALLCKELGRFTASANYMLNCGLGTLLLPVGGVLLLVKGAALTRALDQALPLQLREGTGVLLCAAVCMAACMNDMAAPSVSLEGNSLWILQSLPVKPALALRAKACAQMLVTAPPALFAAACGALALKPGAAQGALAVALTLAWTAFLALLDASLGVAMPILSWTSEIAPIKQSGAVAIALFGSWIICALFAGLYLLAGHRLGATAYMLIWTALLVLAALGLLRWLDTRGARSFAGL